METTKAYRNDVMERIARGIGSQDNRYQMSPTEHGNEEPSQDAYLVAAAVMRELLRDGAARESVRMMLVHAETEG